MSETLEELTKLALSGELSPEAATAGLVMLYEAGTEDPQLELLLIAVAGTEGHAAALDALHALARTESEDALGPASLRERVFERVHGGVERLRGAIRWLDGLALPQLPQLPDALGLTLAPATPPVALREGDGAHEQRGFSFTPAEHVRAVQVALSTRVGAPLRILVRHDAQQCGCDGLDAALVPEAGGLDLQRLAITAARAEVVLELPRAAGAVRLVLRDVPLGAAWEFPIEAGGDARGQG